MVSCETSDKLKTNYQHDYYCMNLSQSSSEKKYTEKYNIQYVEILIEK